MITHCAPTQTGMTGTTPWAIRSRRPVVDRHSESPIIVVRSVGRVSKRSSQIHSTTPTHTHNILADHCHPHCPLPTYMFRLPQCGTCSCVVVRFVVDLHGGNCNGLLIKCYGVSIHTHVPGYVCMAHGICGISSFCCCTFQ